MGQSGAATYSKSGTGARFRDDIVAALKADAKPEMGEGELRTGCLRTSFRGRSIKTAPAQGRADHWPTILLKDGPAQRKGRPGRPFV